MAHGAHDPLALSGAVVMSAIESRSWADLVGLPYAELGRSRAGVDCWGLVRLAFAELAGIDLPSYADGYLSTDDRAEICGLIVGAKGNGAWSAVASTEVKPMDVVVFRRGRFDSHVGLVVNPSRHLMVHAGGHGSRAELWTGNLWLPRLVGFWRHRDLMT